MKTLVVDDGEENRYMLESLLKADGHDVESCANGADALERLAAGRFDLIISDILMPVMDGFQLCRKVRTDRDLCGIAFIVYTATSTGPQDEAFALKIGADRFIQKPCEPDALMAAVGEVMAAARDRDGAPIAEPATEEEALKLYSDRLVRKLEQKVSQAQQEVAARRKAEKALRQSEEKYRTILENIDAGYFEVDLAGNLTFFNDALCRILGYPRSELMGMNNRRFMNAENAKKVFRTFNRVFQTGAPAKALDWHLIKKNGDGCHLDTSVFLVCDDNGKTIGFRGIAQDITGRKRLEEEQARLQARLSQAVEIARLGYWEYDVARDRFIFDDAFYKIFHTTDERVGGYEMSPQDYANRFVHPEDRYLVAEENRKAIETAHPGYRRQLEHRILYADGTVGHISVRFFVVKDKNNKTVKTFGVNQDITERKLAEAERGKLRAQLLQAQKLESVGNLAGGIAHDFNNILSAIIGFTEIALEDVEKGSGVEGSLKEIYSAGKRARDLVKQILTFARKTDAEIRPIKPKTVIVEVLNLLRCSIPTTIEMMPVIESDASVMGNPTQVHQVLMNLCTNAVHAMEEKGGQLQIRLEDVAVDASDTRRGLRVKPGQYVKLTVADTGAGIAPEALGLLFEPYYTTKAKGEGTGLGLAVVHGIVDSCGGCIQVASEHGKGAAFAVYLPAIKADDRYRPQESKAHPTGSERVLVVDDEVSVARMIGQMLDRLGYAATIRTGSLEALELFKAKPDGFDLVVTDMTMPNMTGDRLAVEMMKIRPDIPVVLCTGYSRRISDETAAKIGIRAFAYKPLVKADLARIVRKVLDEQMNRASIITEIF